MYLVMEIPGLPTRPNENAFRHKWAKYAESKKWHKKVGAIAKANGHAGLELTNIKIRFTRHSTRYCDWDAIPASLKAVQDALVISRVIQDDSIKVIPSCPEYRQEKCKRGHEKIVIEIWEL